jgi:GAF domain-containing protein/HAMP domain-containing protein
MRSDTHGAGHRPISIRALLVLGTGLLLLLASLIAVSGYLSLRQLQIGIQTTLEQASRIRELGLTMENEFLLARQEEANFLARWRSIGFDSAVTEYVAAHHAHLLQARAELDELERLAGSANDPAVQALTAEIDTLPSLLDNYELAFQTTISQIQNRSRAGGLESQVAKVLEDLESLVAPLPQPAFHELVLEMRTNEQAYLNTQRQEYVDTARLQVDQFVHLVEASSPADLMTEDGPVAATLLVNKSEAYYQLLGRLVSLDQEIEANTTTFREVTSDINRITNHIAAESEAGLTRAESQLQGVGRRSTLTLAVTAALTLGLGAVVAWVLSRRIVPPLNQLSQAAEELGSGNLEQTVAVRGAEELVTLGAAFNAMAGRLRQTLLGLEHQVTQRTRGLHAAAEVARATTEVLDLNILLEQVVDLVRERFDLYYVGLFLLDPAREVALLRAGTGHAGEEMLARRHSLKVGGESMVGQCLALGKARIALDVGAEAVRFSNPLLPDTRSEMALPLRSRGRVIGAMTVQDTREAAFGEADIAVMQTMADQVAVAIDNARLFAESEAALQEMETIHKHYMGQAWAEYSRARAVRGYQLADGGLAAVGDELLPEVRQAIAAQLPENEDGRSDSDEQREQSAAPALVAPIMLRGLPIGALGLRQGERRRPWTEEEIEVVQTIAQEFALAADNIRLVEDTQRREARERAIREIADRMQRASDMETLMYVTTEELNRRLGGSRAYVRLGTESHLGPLAGNGQAGQGGN